VKNRKHKQIEIGKGKETINNEEICSLDYFPKSGRLLLGLVRL
jgi:hypothetical protein